MKVKKEKSCGCIIIKDNKVLLIQSTKSTFFGGFQKDMWKVMKLS